MVKYFKCFIFLCTSLSAMQSEIDSPTESSSEDITVISTKLDDKDKQVIYRRSQNSQIDPEEMEELKAFNAASGLNFTVEDLRKVKELMRYVWEEEAQGYEADEETGNAQPQQEIKKKEKENFSNFILESTCCKNKFKLTLYTTLGLLSSGTIAGVITLIYHFTANS